MVIVYTSKAGPFKYYIGENPKEISLLKYYFTAETILASPMLNGQNYVFIIEDGSVKFDWERIDVREELTSIVQKEFKKSHLEKIDLYKLGKLHEYETLKALRKSEDKTRIDFMKNPDTDNAMQKTREIAIFRRAENGFCELVLASSMRLSTPLALTSGDQTYWQAACCYCGEKRQIEEMTKTPLKKWYSVFGQNFYENARNSKSPMVCKTHFIKIPFEKEPDIDENYDEKPTCLLNDCYIKSEYENQETEEKTSNIHFSFENEVKQENFEYEDGPSDAKKIKIEVKEEHIE